MKREECAIGKKVTIIGTMMDFAFKKNTDTELGGGEIQSEPKKANGNLYAVDVKWPNGRVMSHPISRLKEVV